MTPRAAGALFLGMMILAACRGGAAPDAEPSMPTAADPASVPVVGVTASPGTGAATAVEPGRPFDASAILEAMRTSRRPGGVPNELQTERIAAAVADAIWTFDGEPWTAMSIGGSCGAQRCTLEVGGTPHEAVGEDLWAFSVTPETAQVELADADLHGVPPDVASDLDDMVRAALPEARDLLLASVRWLPPPETGAFELAYRSGNEEESCRLDVTVDADTESVETHSASDC